MDKISIFYPIKVNVLNKIKVASISHRRDFCDLFRRHMCEVSTRSLGDLVTFPWAFRLRLQLRRRAFRYIFARSAIASLAKDAAPIPNAFGDGNGNWKRRW